MMRNDWLVNHLQKYLDRRSVPQGFKGKQEAQNEEAQALARTLCRLAPSQGYMDWWEQFVERLAEDAKTRAWPTQGELKDAARKIVKPNSPSVRSAATLNEFEIAAKRMAAGQAVGDGYLWGRSAVEMIAAKLVDRDTMAAYRTGAYMAQRSLYGEAVADRWRAEREARHDAAREVYLDGKRGGQSMTSAEMDRLRADLDAFEASIDRRTQEMRRTA